MKAAELKAAVNATLVHYLVNGKDEHCTREFTGVVYPGTCCVVVTWCDAKDRVQQKHFNIEAVTSR